MKTTIELAREAGFGEDTSVIWAYDREGVCTDELKAFEALVRADERKQALAAPVQEPVGYEYHEYRPYGAPGEIRINAILKSRYTMPDGSTAGDYQWLIDQHRASKNTIKLIPLYTTPPAQEFTCSTGLCHYKAVPDALTSADIQEHIEYVAGWNECRQAMMEMMK